MEETLRDVRKKLGLTQKQLAEKANISQVIVSNVESGKNSPRAKTREDIENVLGSIDWLTTRRLPRESKKIATVMEAENQFFKAIEMIDSLVDEQKFRFLVIANSYFARYINTELLRKKLNEIKSGKAIEEIFTDQELRIYSQAASEELRRRDKEGEE